MTTANERSYSPSTGATPNRFLTRGQRGAPLTPCCRGERLTISIRHSRANAPPVSDPGRSYEAGRLPTPIRCGSRDGGPPCGSPSGGLRVDRPLGMCRSIGGLSRAEAGAARGGWRSATDRCLRRARALWQAPGERSAPAPCLEEGARAIDTPLHQARVSSALTSPWPPRSRRQRQVCDCRPFHRRARYPRLVERFWNVY